MNIILPLGGNRYYFGIDGNKGLLYSLLQKKKYVVGEGIDKPVRWDHILF